MSITWENDIIMWKTISIMWITVKNKEENVDKKSFLAPMEGITGYIYRNAINKYFGGVDYYVTPFISPTQTKILNHRELEDILPENNEGIALIPQILCNNANLFIDTANALKEYGYKEINLNLGCPSGTVVSKGKGSGFLADLDALDDFLDEIYNVVHGQMGMDISIKTRIGRDNPDEFHSLLIIFNQYPIKLLTVHPRVRTEFYKGKCHMDIFKNAVLESANPVCYNGDLNSVEDVRGIFDEFPNVNNYMIGRGAIRNPNCFNMIRQWFSKAEDCSKLTENKNDLSKDLKNTLRLFHDEIYAGYEEIFSGDRNVLFKMKELWAYMGDSFENADKPLKKIRKAQKKEMYFDAVDALFEMDLR